MDKFPYRVIESSAISKINTMKYPDIRGSPKEMLEKMVQEERKKKRREFIKNRSIKNIEF